MGKANKARKAGASASSPYDRKQSKPAASASRNIFKFNTNVGQHILKNPGVADAIVEKAHLKPTDVVLEIGPGTGNITVRMLDRVRKVVACELDPRMASEVTKRVQGGPQAKKLEVILGDAIKMDFPPFDVCVSNTPYAISSPLVFKLLSMPNPPRTAILMFQQEFALRLTAKPSDALYCRLSVNAQFYSKITHVLKVGKKNFNPPPKVESAVVRIEPKTGSQRPTIAFAEWDGMLRICFNRKNRTMRASWTTKEILGLVARNYRVWASLNNVSIDESPLENGGDVDMEVDDDGDKEAWGGFDEDVDGDGMDIDGGLDGEDDDQPSFFKEIAAKPVAKTPSKRKRTKLDELVREKVLRALEETELTDRRARTCDENDFLRLLKALNDEGIHFS